MLKIDDIFCLFSPKAEAQKFVEMCKCARRYQRKQFVILGGSLGIYMNFIAFYSDALRNFFIAMIL